MHSLHMTLLSPDQKTTIVVAFIVIGAAAMWCARLIDRWARRRYR
jgi:hypothetical protein